MKAAAPAKQNAGTFSHTAHANPMNKHKKAAMKSPMKITSMTASAGCDFHSFNFSLIVFIAHFIALKTYCPLLLNYLSLAALTTAAYSLIAWHIPPLFMKFVYIYHFRGLYAAGADSDGAVTAYPIRGIIPILILILYTVAGILT
jgi:hypothetical protein